MSKNKKAKNKKNNENKNYQIEDNENKSNKIIIIFVRKCFAIVCAAAPLFTVFISIKNYYREEKILEPKFTLEKDVNEDGTFTLQLFNSGGAIYNPVIKPTVYVEFSRYDEKSDNDIEVIINIAGYYEDQYEYSSEDGAFYIKDNKYPDLEEFIKIYTYFLYDDDVLAYNIIPCYILEYNDSRGRDYKKIYTVTNNNFLDDNSESYISEDNFLKLKEISEEPSPDIVAPLKFEETCVISEYFENGETIKNLIENDQDYYDCLYSSILEVFDSKIVQ